MKRYSVAEARARFSNLLDAAERGEPPIIERRGVRFTLRPKSGARRRTRRRVVIAHVDPSVLDGQWTWAWTLKGLRFTGRRRGR
jgi:antitoxin (DNA-binding transcriptional repressor) of toxin-antitoxin stability system